jgi:AraC-like DNA-binding protein
VGVSASAAAPPRVVLRGDYRLEYARGPSRARASAVALDPTVFVLLDGAVSVVVGEAHHELTAPAAALVNPGTAFSASGASAGERLVVALRPSAIVAAAGRLGVSRDGVLLFRREAVAVDPALELSARRVAIEASRLAGGDERVLDLAVELFAVDLMREHGRADRTTRLEQSRAGLVDRRLRRSIEFMHDNYGRDLSLGEIAATAYLSEYHFARLFKRITGVTPHAYLASLRVEQARRLLGGSDLSIAEVGARVGYQSASHFGKVFRQMTGVTPTAFRDAVLK